jgi:hypothetical protein
MNVSTYVWASAVLGFLLVGARGHAMPTRQETGLQRDSQARVEPTMCMIPPGKLPTRTASTAFTARIYMGLVALERRANVVVRDTLAILPGQSSLKAPMRCEGPRPVHYDTHGATRNEINDA